MRQHRGDLICALALLALAGCSRTSNEQPAPRKLIAAVSIPPQAWLVSQIGGEHVEVLTLVQPGDNHHTYQPSDAQVSRVMQGSVYFRIGLPFESGPWFEAIRSSGKIPIVDARQGIELLQMAPHVHEEDSHGHDHPEEHAHDHAGGDPHIWLSPRLLKIQAGTIARTLAEIDPVHQSDYDRNLLAVNRRLDEVDAKVRALVEPLAGKAFFVFHPAWGYFAAEYGLEQVAIEIDGKQPSDAELTELQKQARQARIRVVFVQPQITGQAAQAVAEAVGGRVQKLDPLAENVADNLLEAAEAIAGSYRDKPSENHG
ncbi:MAG: zinc ABC transporter substrate-binding protein [Pirellulales bacterium]|nr:zinc ABC transporter substrate-binding protein [Pirellulales bacterium]